MQEHERCRTMAESIDLISGMSELDRKLAEAQLLNINPDDAKYHEWTRKVAPYLSADAEWRKCAEIQAILLETRVEFGQAERKHIDEVQAALWKISPLNISLMEKKMTHDQLAVMAIGFIMSC